MNTRSDYDEIVAAVGDGVPDAAQYQRLTTVLVDVPETRSLVGLDPFSAEYRAAVEALYLRIRGRAETGYVPERDEASAGAASNPWTDLSPWGFRDAALVSEHLISWGAILRDLGAPPGGKVLEYGPGSGQILLMLARLGYDVAGVDIDLQALADISRQADALGLPVRTERARFGEGFAGETFDAIVFYEAFHHAIDFMTLLDGLHARLRPGGRIVLCGEPIVPAPGGPVPFPWGPRLDGLSAFCMRRHGWMELGFTHDFFVAAAERAGWAVVHRPHPDFGRAATYVLTERTEAQAAPVTPPAAPEPPPPPPPPSPEEIRIARLEAELAAVHASTSWRLTRPVRAVGRALARLSRAGGAGSAA